MLLAGELSAHAPGPAKDLFIAFFIATVLIGGWLTGEWIAGELDQSKLHPGYLLPTVAGGLLGAEGAAQFGLRGAGWMSFGIGMLCWLLLGSLILNRLLLVKPLAPLLQPTLAIELAPPAVAGSAYFLLHGPTPTPFAYALAGYTVLMVLVQLRLLPVYIRLKFSPGFWSFTFSWSAVAAIALRWGRRGRSTLPARNRTGRTPPAASYSPRRHSDMSRGFPVTWCWETLANRRTSLRASETPP